MKINIYLKKKEQDTSKLKTLSTNKFENEKDDLLIYKPKRKNTCLCWETSTIADKVAWFY